MGAVLRSLSAPLCRDTKVNARGPRWQRRASAHSLRHGGKCRHSPLVLTPERVPFHLLPWAERPILDSKAEHCSPPRDRRGSHGADSIRLVLRPIRRGVRPLRSVLGLKFPHKRVLFLCNNLIQLLEQALLVTVRSEQGDKGGQDRPCPAKREHAPYQEQEHRTGAQGSARPFGCASALSPPQAQPSGETGRFDWTASPSGVRAWVFLASAQRMSARLRAREPQKLLD